MAPTTRWSASAAAAQVYHGRVERRTPAYWPTRIMLAVGLIATVAVVLLASLETWLLECFSCGPTNVLGVPSSILQAGIAVGLAVAGLVWMLRIVRGSRDR